MLKYTEFITESNFFKLKDYLNTFINILNKIADISNFITSEHDSAKEKSSANFKVITTLSSDKYLKISFETNGKNHVMKLMENDGEIFYLINDKEYLIDEDITSEYGLIADEFSKNLKDVLSLEGEELIKKLEYLNRPITRSNISKTTTITPSKVDTGAYLHINNGGINVLAEEDLRFSTYGETSTLNLVISANHFGVQTNEIRIPVDDDFLCEVEILIKQMREQLKEKKYTLDF